jgi:hypothetical protein
MIQKLERKTVPLGIAIEREFFDLLILNLSLFYVGQEYSRPMLGQQADSPQQSGKFRLNLSPASHAWPHMWLLLPFATQQGSDGKNS